MLSVSKELHILIQRAPNTRGNGSVGSVMDMASKYGPMAHVTRETGKTIELMALASSLTLMEMFMKATG